MSADLTPDRVRRTLAAVADRYEADPDAWDEIRGRVEAGGIEVAGLTTTPRHRLRPVLVAAAILVAGAVAAALLVHRGPDQRRVATSSPPAAATGWYVPEGLPDGWTLLRVESTRSDDTCPCREVVWRDAAGERWIVASSEAVAPGVEPATSAPDDHVSTFEVVDGIEAEMNAPAGSTYWDVRWTDGDQQAAVFAIGVDPALAAGVARLLHADPTFAVAPVPGLQEAERWDEPDAVGPDVIVDVQLRAPSGDLLGYSLQAPRAAIALSASYRPTDLLAGRQPLPTLRYRSLGPDIEGPIPMPLDLLGRWPGATVRAPGGHQIDEDGTTRPTEEETLALMAALRPASAERWRSFVAGAQNRDRALTAADTLQELIDGSADGTPPPTGSEGSLEGLELTVTAEPRVAAHEDLGVVLTVHNPTAEAIADPTCALDRATVALLGADEATAAQLRALDEPDGVWATDGPCDGGLTLEPGGSKAIRLEVRAELARPAGGELPPGRYRATIAVEGLDARPSAPVQVG
ncbi:MAG: hypothetical protein KDB04_01125 [Acidimicrobiales bacterium]|nr:hypothetical protein [Acidimicrobiales bacterium]HRW37371.1 hypothetical protein [Aquihabitans sp.]